MEGFEIVDKRFKRFVLFNAPLEKLAEGFGWLEGPVWFADMQCLLFSDIPNNRIMRWTEAGGIVDVLVTAASIVATVGPAIVVGIKNKFFKAKE
jgi:sugar lactone lactonase YvrE